MRSVREWFLVCFLTVAASACSGAGNQDIQAEKTSQMDKLINMRAEAFNASFSLFNFTPPVSTPSQTGTPEEKPTEETATRQSLVTGTVVKETGSAGNVRVEAREAEEGHPALAATNLEGPRYFSLVVPHRDQGLILSAQSDDGQKTQVYLGPLSARVNDVELKLLP
jgi:hypothetical protein